MCGDLADVRRERIPLSCGPCLGPRPQVARAGLGRICLARDYPIPAPTGHVERGCRNRPLIATPSPHSAPLRIFPRRARRRVPGEAGRATVGPLAIAKPARPPAASAVDRACAGAPSPRRIARARSVPFGHQASITAQCLLVVGCKSSFSAASREAPAMARHSSCAGMGSGFDLEVCFTERNLTDERRSTELTDPRARFHV